MADSGNHGSKKQGKSATIGSRRGGCSDSNAVLSGEEEKLVMSPHQFEIAIVEMPRLGDEMREALRRVFVDNKTQSEVAKEMGLLRNNVSEKCNTLKEIYAEKLERNDFISIEVIVPKRLIDACREDELYKSESLLKYQKIMRQLHNERQEDGGETED